MEKKYKDIAWAPKPNEITQHVTMEQPPENAATSAFVFAFKNEQLLLANVGTRGWDIPGGHKEWGETLEEVAVRELFEETGASLTLMGYLGYQHVKLLGGKPEGYAYPYPNSYMAFYWGVIEDIGEPTASMEVGPAKLFVEDKARQLDCIKLHEHLYNAALERIRVTAL